MSGISRITKKLVPSLQHIDGAIIMVNASDPQLSTITLFESAVSDIGNFMVINKCDKVSEDEAQILANKFTAREPILASLKTGRGLEEIKTRLNLMSGKILVAGIFNSGKTSLINALTGECNPVDNLPGTTLEFSEHRYGDKITLVDSIGQIIDISKPLMVSIDLTGCKTTTEKIFRCLNEDLTALAASISGAIPDIEKAVEVIRNRVDLAGGKVVICGAGASALVAMEMAGQAQETGLPVMVFTNNFSMAQPISFAKGFGEDEMELARYCARAVNPNDVAIAVSASGGTGFVFTFLEIAQKIGAATIAITENRDTPLGEAADIVIKSDAKPEGPSSSKVQIAHLAIGHALILTLADIRGIDAEKSINFMLSSRIRNKRMGIK